MDINDIKPIVENIEINEHKKIKYNDVRYDLYNDFSKLKVTLKPNRIIYILSFFIISFIFAFIGVAIVSIITNGEYRLAGMSLPIIMLFINSTISKKITKLIFKKRVAEFNEIVRNLKMKTIKNTISSNNQNFIRELYELETNKLTKSMKDLKINDWKEDLDFDLINQNEYDYLIQKI